MNIDKPEPRIIWEYGAQRVVFDITHQGHGAVFAEKLQRDAMGGQAWVTLDETEDDALEMFKRSLIALAAKVG